MNIAAVERTRHDLLLAATTFLFVFGWKMTAAADIILLVSAAVAFVAFVMYDEPLDRRMLGLMWPMAALAGVALLHVAIGGLSDTQLAQRSIRTVVNTAGAAALVVLYQRRHGEAWIARLCSHLFWGIVAHSLLVLAMYVIPPLRTAIYAMAGTANYVNDSTSFKLGFRVPGLTYGLSQTSVLHLFGMMLSPLAWRATRNAFARTGVVFGVLMILFSMLLIGRSGLFIAVLVIPPAAIASRLGNATRRRINWRRLAIPLAALSVALATGAAYAIRNLPEHFITYNLVRAGEVILALTEPGESGTVRAVQAMYILPSDPVTLLVGEGTMGRDAFAYVSSDVGYVRVLFASGIVGSILLLAPFAFGLACAARAIHADRTLAIVTAATLVATLILHFKEIAVLTRNQWSVQALLIGCCIAVSTRAASPKSLPRRVSREAGATA